VDDMLLRSALRPAPDCPPIEVLSEHLTGAEGNEARATAEFHLRQCLHCRTEMDLLYEFETGGIRPDEVASVQWVAERLKRDTRAPAADRATGWWTAWRMPKLALGVASLALVALLAVGISSEWRLRQSLTKPVPEFGNEVQRTRLIEIIRTPGFFAWKPVAGAARYDLTVRTVDGAAIIHKSFTGTTLAFPPEVDALVKAGKLLEWEVIARDSASTEIAGSGVQRLRQAASSSH
jgi:hypothetical protein